MRELTQVLVGLGIVVTLALGSTMLMREATAGEAFLVGVSVAVVCRAGRTFESVPR